MEPTWHFLFLKKKEKRKRKNVALSFSSLFLPQNSNNTYRQTRSTPNPFKEKKTLPKPYEISNIDKHTQRELNKSFVVNL